MKSFAITAVCLVAAVIVVLSTRLLIPALIIIFKHIEAGFAPEDTEPLALAPATTAAVQAEATPVITGVTKKGTPRKRAPRKTKTPVVVEA